MEKQNTRHQITDHEEKAFLSVSVVHAVLHVCLQGAAFVGSSEP